MDRDFLLGWLSSTAVKGNRRWWSGDRAQYLAAIERLTAFLPEEVTIAARIRLIRDGVITAPSCGQCGGPVGWDRGKFPIYCSRKCAAASPQVVEKREKAIKDRFGDEGLAHPNVQNKIRKSLEAKYGSYETSVAIRLEKARDTVLDRYGEDCFFQTDAFKKAASLTMTNRYGGHHLKTEQSINRLKATNLTRYGVQFPIQNAAIKKRQEATIRARHGVENPMKSEILKQKAKDTSHARYGTYHTRRHLADDAHSLFENDILFADTINAIGVDGFVRETNYCRDYVVAKANALGLIKLSPNSSIGEKELGDFIGELGFEYISTKRLIPPQEIDIWIPEKEIGIEYCGHYWHSDAHKMRNYHRDKLDSMRPHGKLITLLEGEWITRNQQVKNRLASLLGQNTPVAARRTKFSIVDKTVASEFMEEHHVQGAPPVFSAAAALYHEGEIIACGGFTRRNKEWELVRYCSVGNVIGGLSKLVSNFSKNMHGSIYTFHDLRWGYSSSYLRAGFVQEAVLPPDYFYVKNLKFEHKFNHRKKFYKDRYDISSLTEREIMKMEGWLRFYDCGKIRYRYGIA